MQVPDSWSLDGEQLLYFTNAEKTGGDLHVLDLAKTAGMNWRASAVSDFQVGPAYQDYAQFSPDGEWIAFLSDELGRMANLWVCRFDSPEATKRPVTEGGVALTFPGWLGEDQLLYLNERYDGPQPPLRRIQRMKYAVDGDAFRWEFLEPWPSATTVNHFAVDPDGTRILVQRPEVLPDPDRFNKQVVLFSNFAQYVEEQIRARVD